MRLVRGRTAREGRLEIMRSGVWGTVCDDSFSSVDARVACRQLGYRLQHYSVYSNELTIHPKQLRQILTCLGNDEALLSGVRHITVPIRKLSSLVNSSFFYFSIL